MKETFNFDKEPNIKPLYSNRGVKYNKLDKLINEGNGFKFAQDCDDTLIMNIIKFIINSKISDTNKKNLIQQFLLNWLCINTIKISIDSLKE